MPIPTDRLSLNGARPVRIPQAGAVPGSKPRRSPPSVTGGPSRLSCNARRQRGNATGTTQPKPFTIMHWNAEGVFNKKPELEHWLYKKEVSICCIQETHLQADKAFKVRGYQCFRADRNGRHKGGILTLVRNNINAYETSCHMDGAEFHQLKIKTKKLELSLTNYYCPNDKPLSLDSIDTSYNNFLIVGDFNSHSQSWGYATSDKRGDEVEEWQDDHQLILANSPYDPPTFYSRRWHTTSTPDLALCTESIHRDIQREVGAQLGGSDHKPVILTINSETLSSEAPFPRWNYKKAHWGLFAHRTNILTNDIEVQGRDINHVVKDFNSAVLKAAYEAIPRGARKDYKPYWSDNLQELQDNLTSARITAENQPSQANNDKLQQAKAKFLKTKLEAKRRSWREKTANINMENNGTKLWKLTKQLNDEATRYQKITLEENNDILCGKRAANQFVKAYSKASDIPITPEMRNRVRKERKKSAPIAPNEAMTCPLTLQELSSALKRLKKKKSPGPDNITNEMLTNLGNVATRKLLEIYNLSWQSGTLPQIWREAVMIPVYKKGKDRKKAPSYRPISLTSCVVKTMERIINKRLMWYLESEAILSEEQAGFRQFRSTEDQATYVSQEVEDAFQGKKVLLAMWIDLQKAFDKVWTDGLLLKIQRCGVGGNMFKWVTSFLHNRRARVAVNNKKSKTFLLRHGVPQGGVISPTLFLIFIDDLVQELPKGTKAALYADDLVVWCVEEHATTATYRMQLAADKLCSWTKEWGVSINTEKSSTTLFTLSNKKEAGPVKIGDAVLKTEDEPTYLGVTFDKRQTWKPHIENAEAKAKRKLAILRKLSGTNWGATGSILKTVYQGSVRPHLEYGSTAWCATAKSNQQSLDKVQNQALRLITGAMKTTPINAMEKHTAIQPLQQRREAKILVQAEKFRCLEKHPMKRKVEGLTKNRLKRSSFIHCSKKLARQHTKELPPVAFPLKPAPSKPWETTTSNIKVKCSVPQLDSAENKDLTARRSLTQAMLADQYPQEAWAHAYTDGSANNAVSDGGAGVLIRYPDGQIDTAAIPTGKHCSNYGAEIAALQKAASLVLESNNECQQVVFLTDSLSSLEALQASKEEQLQVLLQQVSTTRRVVLQWIPAHCGIPGNEQADQLAKEGASGQQFDNQLTFQEKKTLIKAAFKPSLTKDDTCFLPRQEQVIIFRLRTGHNRLNSHMFRKLKLVPTPKCSCGAAEQTVFHIMKECPNHAQLRRTLWPTEPSLQTMMYGSRQDLETTAQFIVTSGLTV